METGGIKARTLFMTLGAVICTEVAVTGLASIGEYHPKIITGAARLFEIILIMGIVHVSESGTPSIGLDRSILLIGLKRGLVWSAGLGAIGFIVLASLFIAGSNPSTLVQTNQPEDYREIFLLFSVGGIVGPLAEEVFFRGILYGYFRRCGVSVAIVLSTCIFVAAHSLTPGSFLLRVAGGIIFAAAYEAHKNLMVPITIHATGNMTVSFLSLIL